MLLESSDTVETIVDPKDAGESADLRYVSDARPGIRRKKAGTGFAYTRPDGLKLTEKDVLKRIKTLAIPPALTEVWRCPFADGHVQATGRDAKGRKQYRYHPRFREVRESTKYEHVVAFADALPASLKRRPCLPIQTVSRRRSKEHHLYCRRPDHSCRHSLLSLRGYARAAAPRCSRALDESRSVSWSKTAFA